MANAVLDRSAVETFAGCAAFYDALTAHHDYEDVADIVERLIGEYGHPGRRLLDVACGTGKSFLPFLGRGYEVTACDVSREMLARARAKAENRARIVLADMRELGTLGEFDLVTCIDEPVNYLLERAEVAGTFAGVARNLRPGGLLVFDVNTIHTFRSIFARDECYEQEGWLFVWRGEGDGRTEPGGTSGFAIEAFTERAPGCWERHTNRHTERHYPTAEIEALLADAGLEPLGVWGVTPDGRPHAAPDEHSHTKHFHVARNATGR